jgi:hypothetical protein
MAAIDVVMDLAENAGAMLVAVSLVSTSPERKQSERLQPSRDFLEVIHSRAAHVRISVECYEIFTPDVQRSLTLLVREEQCDGIVLVMRGKQTPLMQDEEAERLLLDPPTTLVLIRLPEPGSPSAWHLRAKLLFWLRRCWKPQDRLSQTPEPLWVRVERPHLE